MSNKFYIGITIGPIVDTLDLADGPGGLWCGSALFSNLSYRLCEKIQANFANNGLSFIMPAFEASSQAEGSSFPDRIVVSLLAEDMDTIKKTMDQIQTTVVEEITKDLVDTVEDLKKYGPNELQTFLTKYFRINYVIAPEAEVTKDGKNCILHLSPILDLMESASPVVADCTHHPLLTLFNSRTEGASGRNKNVHNCYLMQRKGNNRNQLLNRDGKIYSIEEIASAGAAVEGEKNEKYFAVLYADGDHIGSLLSRLPKDENITPFSKACLEYNKAASQLVGEFGGVTIYAGGDDLLCLLPLKGKDGSTIVDFCSKLTDIFDQKITKIYDEQPSTAQNTDRPSISIGISVNYSRYPLYEALNDARSMLFAVAKDRRCSTAISVRKASGQTFGFVLPNAKVTINGVTQYQAKAMNALPHLLKKSWAEMAKALDYKKNAENDTEDDTNDPISDEDISRSLHSVLYSMHRFHFGFELCSSKGIPTTELFNNFFDSGAHNTNRHYINLIRALCEEQRKNKPFRAILGNKYALKDNNKEHQCEEFHDCMDAILRFAKFYCEEAGK